MVCFAPYSVYVHLEDNILITVEAGFEHIHNGKRHVLQLSSPATESSLLTVLEGSITSAVVAQNGDLQLTISNGDSLRVFKEPEYESYRIKVGDEELTA